MAYLAATGFGSSWQAIMGADDIVPGDVPSYAVAKQIYLTHPLGGKIAETPVRLAQSQDREITVQGVGEEELVDQFNLAWQRIEATQVIFNLQTQARVYGLASIGAGTVGDDPKTRLDKTNLWKKRLYFNLFDPLNTAGLVVNQDPNSPLFQKHSDVIVNGQPWHRSRTVTQQNERPIYIAWTSSAFSFSGRSCYQRCLYPLKSFLFSMRTDDMVVRKVGVVVTKMKSPGSFITQQMQRLFGVKRNVVKEAEVDNVISIGVEESVESLNLQNLDGPHSLARENIIKNIAVGAPIPSKLLTEEAYVLGFGEGTEDAKNIAQFVDGVRLEMRPPYDFMDDITMHLAWNPEWYEAFQKRYPADYGEVEYKTAFYRWKNSFRADWPSLLKEPPSEQVQVDDVKLKGLIAIWQVYAPELDPANKVALAQTVFDGFNAREDLFEGSRFTLDAPALLDFLEEQAEQQKAATEQEQKTEEGASAPRPFASRDSIDARRHDAVVALSGWLASHPPLDRRSAR
jgi:hypothetical protein